MKNERKRKNNDEIEETNLWRPQQIIVENLKCFKVDDENITKMPLL